MFDFSGVSNRSSLGKALRLPLRFVPGRTQVRILQGPLKGKRWIAGSSNHGCWLGSYELEKQIAVAAAIRPGMVCFDIGANVGFYTLLFSHLAGAQGSVIAFEPESGNCRILRQHLAMNACNNVALQELALTNFDGMAHFDPSESNSQGRLSENGRLSVTCARLDSLIAGRHIPLPDVIKMDVEGAEAAVLDGASEVLSRNKPVIFLATHGEQPHRECCHRLRRIGYRLAPLTGKTLTSCDEIVAVPA